MSSHYHQLLPLTSWDVNSNNNNNNNNNNNKNENNNNYMSVINSINGAPVDWLRTGLAILLAVLAGTANHLAHVWTNQRMPRIDPLPEIWFDFFPEVPWLMKGTEIIMFVLFGACIFLVFTFPNKTLLLRRYFFIFSLCYFYRALCMCLIQPPEPSRKTPCETPIENVTFFKVFKMAANLAMTGTFEISRERNFNLCGDLIISGHTFSLMLPYLTIEKYGRNRFFRALSKIGFCMVLVGMSFILFARRHYTIDVLLAYYLTTRIFWTYHTLLKYPNSTVNRVWWFEIFKFFENGNISNLDAE